MRMKKMVFDLYFFYDHVSMERWYFARNCKYLY